MKVQNNGRSKSFAALLFAAWLCDAGCGRDAFVLVNVKGVEDNVVAVELTARFYNLQAREIYVGHPRQVSFFLPDGSLGAKLTVEIYAYSTACLLAAGFAATDIENRPRLELDVQLEPLAPCQ